MVARLMTEALRYPESLSLAAGFTDNQTLPDALIAALASHLPRQFPDRAYLQYGMNQGHPGLRRAILHWLSGFRAETGPSRLDLAHVLVTNGSQQALYLALQALCEPGDRVLVESPGYFVFLEMVRAFGAEAVSIPSFADGSPDLPALRALLASWQGSGELARLKAVYYCGWFGNPSGRSWSEAEKDGLLRTLSSCDSHPVVIEDAAYRDLGFEGPPEERSLLSLSASAAHNVLYTGTFTKPLATGLKTGFAVSPNPALVLRLARLKGHQDFGTAHYLQAIIEQVLLGGHYGDHLDAIRPRYARRMNLLLDALESSGLEGLGWSWLAPEGGILLWLRGPEGLRTSLGSEFHRACLEAGVLYVPGDLCLAEGTPQNALRIAVGALPEDRLALAVERLLGVARRFSPGA